MLILWACKQLLEMSGKKRASTRNRVVSSSPERMSCGRIHSPEVVIEDHECYPQDDPRALALASIAYAKEEAS